MSDHWVARMRTYFTRIDFDGDGKITRADFEGMAKRFGESGKLAGDKAKKLNEDLCAVWDKYLSAVGGGEGIDQKSFIGGMKKLVKDPKMKATLEGPLPNFFHAVDTNADGFISAEEYADFFTILGLDPATAIDSFKAIDTNNDGLLSEEEFVTAGSQFFLSDDPKCPTRFFWGPLC